MHIEIIGDYDIEDNMYIAVFRVYRDSDTVYTSYVRGKSPHSRNLKETLGYIRALQHALAWLGTGRRKIVTIICRNPEVYNLLTSNSKTKYSEVSTIRKQLKESASLVKLVQGV